MSDAFTIINEHGLEILGNCHVPDQPPVACALLLHGFKGYKDYGFIPLLAHDLCERGVLVHRFNFSTSGMTNDISTFARPDLFELDTWTRQVGDVRRVVQAVREGEIAGMDLPLFLIGHSRGGATALLSAGRHQDELGLAGVATINAVDRCCRMSETEQRAMLERGYTITQSARTKQDLRIDAGWLREQLASPEDHDVLLQGSRCGLPACILHGDADDAVEISAGEAIAHKLNTPLIVLKNANHVLNMPNPSEIRATRSPTLLKTTDEIARFIHEHAFIV
ncbi:MAG: alpha/beta hydrolase [Phycisphaerales bacterium]